MEEVTQSAFMMLGQNGVIQTAKNHACAECSQPYKAQSDIIVNSDHSAVLGVDDLVSAGIEQSSSNTLTFQNSESEMDVDLQNVTIIVVDGIVVGTKVF
jgi:hypothetical protein